MKPVPGKSEYLGDLLSRQAIGHGGATGTAVWADPASSLFCIIFTNQPGWGHELGRLSNALAAGLID